MTTHAKRMWNAICALAEGREDVEAQTHLETCQECQKLLGEARAMFSGLAYPVTAAPQALVDAAYALMPFKSSRLRLLSGSLQLSGARAKLADDFQLLLGDDSTQFRVMYTKLPAGWQVMLSMPEADSSAWKDDSPLDSDTNNRVAFIVESLDQSDLVVVSGGVHFIIPSATEVMDVSG